MKKINIGFKKEYKLNVINAALEKEDITKVVYFTHDKNEPLEIDFPDVEYRTWSDAIMYRYFYPLLEKIDNHTLLIFDEMMRTQKRNDLTYNCLHHYGNQTNNILVFQWFPMIENQEDFMILLDMAYPYTYKGQPFSNEFLKMESVTIFPVFAKFWRYLLDDDITDEEQEAYDEEKEMLFENIGNKDPDTIPRTLHIWCGTHYKKKYHMTKHPDDTYITRNSRFKGFKTVKWADKSNADIIVDFPVRQIQFNDYCYKNQKSVFYFIDTGLSADKVYFNHYENWAERLGEIYAEASLSTRECR